MIWKSFEKTCCLMISKNKKRKIHDRKRGFNNIAKNVFEKLVVTWSQEKSFGTDGKIHSRKRDVTAALKISWEKADWWLI